MKREILCPECYGRQFGGVREKYPGEGWRSVGGKLIISCLCDSCGGNLGVRDSAYAVSIYRNNDPNINWMWEEDYLFEREV